MDFTIEGLLPSDQLHMLFITIGTTIDSVSVAIFQTLIIHRKAFHSKFLDDTVCSLSEPYRTGRSYLVANNNNSTEIVVVRIINFAVRSSYSKFSNN